jgi:hypothetical protein
MNERTLFLEALDRPQAERAAFLETACAGNEELRAKVEALIGAHEKSGRFLDPERTLDTPDHNTEFDDEGNDLAFLQPPVKPGSLGRLGHYECLEVLGRGGFGTVFRAFDEKLHRVVAIKAMNPALAATSPPRKRFLREARAAAAIKHEHVVAVFAVEEHPLPYLVMEFVAGETLQQHIDRTGPLEPDEIVKFSREIALGLEAAHASGLIHRDIKPGNILIEAGPVPKVKITDFGLARAADDASLTQSGVICGTPMYMSPEQADGKPLDPRSDLFSLGSVMYVMASGRPPFRADSTMAVLKRVTDDTPRPIREVVETVPPWLCGVVERLHAKDPGERFQTAREVIAALDRGAAISAPVAKPASMPRRWGRIAALVLAAAGPLLAVVVLKAVDRGVVRPLAAPTTATVASATGPRPPAEGADRRAPEWVQLFNGRDLTGWAVATGGLGNWKVVDGAITCSGTQSHLYSERNDYGDFHLRTEVRVNETGNGGIYFRAGKPLAVLGDYEAQITINPQQRQRTGSLYDLVRIGQNLVPADTWFTYEVIADGNRIRLFVDGKETANHVDNRAGRPAKGFIALQHHDPMTQVQYRKIEISEPRSPVQKPKSPPAAKVVVEPKDYDDLATGEWIDLLPDAAAFDKVIAGQPGGRKHRTPLHFKDGTFTTGRGDVVFPDHRGTDGILTATLSKVAGQSVALRLRQSAIDQFISVDYFGDGKLVLGRSLGTWKHLRAVSVPETPGNTLDLALAAVGNRAYLFVNGRREAVVDLDAALGAGFPAVAANGEKGVGEAEGRFKSIRYQPLAPDALASAVRPTTPEEIDRYNRDAAKAVRRIGTIHINGEKNGWKDPFPETPFAITKVALSNAQVMKSTRPLESLRWCTELEELFLHSSRVFDADVEWIGNCTKLVRVDFTQSPVTGKTMRLLAAAKGLKVLQAWAVIFKGEEILPLAALNPESVNFGSNYELTDSCKPVLEKWTNLVDLQLPFTLVSDKLLEAAPAWQNLEILNLIKTAVGDRGLEHLSKCKNLQKLDVRKTKVTADGVKKLQTALPNCKIEWDDPKK